MTCDVVATGSTGNCVIINDAIAIDMGVPYKKISKYADKLQLVLLTHIHGDHFNRRTVKKLHTLHPLIRFGCCPWMVAPLLDAGVPATRIHVYAPGTTLAYDSHLRLTAVPVFHDVENCAYKINIDGEKLFYATDTGNLYGVEAAGYDWYLIEANYTVQEIEKRIKTKTENGEFVYEYRAMQTHLSREKADEFLAQNAVPGVSKIVYLHQHKEGSQDHA